MVGSVIRDQFLLAKDWPFASLLVMILVVFLIALFSLQSRIARRTAGEF
jgi:spermidine/putrescine transport system permease protein